jgi:hypothetical protein
LNDRGEKVGNPFKSSLFGKPAGIEALERRIEKSVEIIKNKRLKERSKQVIAAVMRTVNNRADFEKALEKQGISVFFRTNDGGRIYGATFIDHEQKCVFNGSRLGREFSANAFNNLFGGSRRQEPEQPQHRTDMPFEPDSSRHEKEAGSGIGDIFDLFTPDSSSGENYEEEAFIGKLKRRKRRQRKL